MEYALELGSALASPLSVGAFAANAPAAGRVVSGNEDARGKTPAAPGDTTASGEQLTDAQKQQVDRLKKRDAEVRAHEQAHAQVGGSYASAPSYKYTKGLDGKKYATSGEVQIDASPERTPEATIRKMEIVIRAALAPAEPSSQDQAVARQAQATRQQAQAELSKQRAEANEGEGSAGLDALSGPLAAQALAGEQSESDTSSSVSQAFEVAAQAYQAAASLFGAAA